MPTPTFSVFLAVSLSTTLVAQTHGLHESTPSPLAPAPEHLAAGGGGARTGGDELFVADELRARVAASRQDPDYSLYGQFHQAHGDFMLRYERFDPMLEVGAMFLPDASVQNEQGRFDLINAHADLEMPFMVSTEAYVTLGAYYGSRHYQTRNMPDFPDETLYSAGMHLGFGLFLDDNMLLEAKVSPGVWSDWDGTLHHNDFDFPASALLTIRSTDELFLKFGARYNEIYQDANILPYLGLSWQTEGFRLDVLFPEYVEASFWPSEGFGILAGVEVDGAEYRVRSSAATNHEQADLRVQEVVIYGGTNWRFNDFVSLRARAGMTVAGDYKLDDGLASTPRVDGTLKPALYVDVTMGIDW